MYLTDQYNKSIARSRTSIEGVVLRCNIYSYSHLLIDLSPKTVDTLKYCINSGSVFLVYLPAGKETIFWTLTIQYVSVLSIF